MQRFKVEKEHLTWSYVSERFQLPYIYFQNPFVLPGTSDPTNMKTYLAGSRVCQKDGLLQRIDITFQILTSETCKMDTYFQIGCLAYQKKKSTHLHYFLN